MSFEPLTSSSSLLATATSCVAIMFCFILVLHRQERRLSLKASLPPGPRYAWFGLGDNRSDVPKYQPWKTYTLWHQKYGPVISVGLGNKPVIVLGSIKAATDLLEKRGNIYSSRPRNIIGGEILSGNLRGVGMPYGTRWRNWRSLVHAGLSIESSRGYMSLQSLESTILLRDLVDEKDSSIYSLHIRRFALSVSTSVGYGKRVTTLQDPIVLANIEIDKYFLKALSLHSIVEYWPILLRLPKFLQWFRWMPEKMRIRDTRIYMNLLDDVRERVLNGTANPCIAVCGLDRQKGWGLSDVELAYACSAPWQAGGSSTTGVIEMFIMAMLLFPSVMSKAQAEIDTVVGRSRQPEFEDMEHLPYTQAVIKEVQRWRPILPLGVAHSTTHADEYEGRFIPDGCTIYANVHAMARDPELFPDPDEFRPERFLGPDTIPTFTAGFGFGRRRCAGMHIAINSLSILAVKLLWAFNIQPCIDDSTGDPIIPNPDDLQGELLVRPRHLVYTLSLRGDRKRTREVISMEAESADGQALAWTS